MKNSLFLLLKATYNTVEDAAKVFSDHYWCNGSYIIVISELYVRIVQTTVNSPY